MHRLPWGHAVPHLPQLFGSVMRLAHELPHFSLPLAQVRPHFPSLHRLPMGHFMPQPPQWAPSVCRFTQPPPQLVVPMGQATAQAPFEHTLPGGQALAHAPQLRGSVSMSTHSTPHCLRVQLGPVLVAPQPATRPRANRRDRERPSMRMGFSSLPRPHSYTGERYCQFLPGPRLGRAWGPVLSGPDADGPPNGRATTDARRSRARRARASSRTPRLDPGGNMSAASACGRAQRGRPRYGYGNPFVHSCFCIHSIFAPGRRCRRARDRQRSFPRARREAARGVGGARASTGSAGPASFRSATRDRCRGKADPGRYRRPDPRSAAAGLGPRALPPRALPGASSRHEWLRGGSEDRGDRSGSGIAASRPDRRTVHGRPATGDGPSRARAGRPLRLRGGSREYAKGQARSLAAGRSDRVLRSLGCGLADRSSTHLAPLRGLSRQAPARASPAGCRGRARIHAGVRDRERSGARAALRLAHRSDDAGDQAGCSAPRRQHSAPATMTSSRATSVSPAG